MRDTDATLSVLMDEAMVATMMPWPCPSEFGAGGRYRLEELVGAGRSSLVYRATDQTLSSTGFSASVAIKIGRRNDGNFVEALTARRIVHPNVLRVLDRGVADGGFGYVVTEFVQGGDLQGKPGPWEAEKAAAFMAKLARAVHAAHSAGVVHCDLKPANILLTTEGEPKLADFDLSRSVVADEDDSRGNLAFMSPEQFAGTPEGLTPPSDVYALGGILYFLLTGKFPNGDSVEKVARSHRLATPAPSTGRRDELERIVGRALARPRDERYESAAALASDLERWIGHEPLAWGTTPAARRAKLWCRRHPYRAAAVGGLAALVVASGVVAWDLIRTAENKRRADLENQAEVNRKTQEQIAETQERMKAQIRRIFRSVAGHEDLQEQILPTLVWLDWMCDVPVIGQEGKLLLSSERVDALRHMIEVAESNGRGTDLDAKLSRFALAHFLIVDREYVAAAELMPRVQSDWESIVGPTDPMMISIEAMTACAHASENAAKDRAGTRAALTKLEQRMREIGVVEPARRLILRELEAMK
jgi:hypothetical protein